MSDTRFVRGQGGVIVQMDVPPKGTNRREIFDYMLAKGDLSFVTDEVEEYTTRGGGQAWRLKHEPVTHWDAEDPGDLDDLDKDQLLSVASVRGIEGVDGRTSKPNLLKALHGQGQEPEVEGG
jgi:hypothetical protein